MLPVAEIRLSILGKPEIDFVEQLRGLQRPNGFVLEVIFGELIQAQSDNRHELIQRFRVSGAPLVQ